MLRKAQKVALLPNFGGAEDQMQQTAASQPEPMQEKDFEFYPRDVKGKDMLVQAIELVREGKSIDHLPATQKVLVNKIVAQIGKAREWKHLLASYQALGMDSSELHLADFINIRVAPKNQFERKTPADLPSTVKVIVSSIPTVTLPAQKASQITVLAARKVAAKAVIGADQRFAAQLKDKGPVCQTANVQFPFDSTGCNPNVTKHYVEPTYQVTG